MFGQAVALEIICLVTCAAVGQTAKPSLCGYESTLTPGEITGGKKVLNEYP